LNDDSLLVRKQQTSARPKSHLQTMPPGVSAGLSKLNSGLPHGRVRVEVHFGFRAEAEAGRRRRRRGSGGGSGALSLRAGLARLLPGAQKRSRDDTYRRDACRRHRDHDRDRRDCRRCRDASRRR
jgi:hypothetical protein